MNTRFCPVCRRNFGNLKHCPEDGAPLRPLPTNYPDPGIVIDEEFELQSGMAAGGMSRIYRSMWRGQGRPTAVKVLDPRLSAHPYTIDRFYREARVSLLLDHPNCIDVYTFGPTRDGHHVIVMELLGGESLGSLLRRVGHLPWQRAVHVVIEVCDALGHSHGRRVIHRDIKPDNIQLTGAVGPDERVKLMDFGIAYVSADSSFSEAAPGSTNVSGTPAYMSPEQIRGVPLDGRSDLYALGILLYEMLTSKRPFPGEDPIEVCRAQLYDKPPPLLENLPHGTTIPPELASLVRELMAKSRRSRVPSVGALLSRLMGLLSPEQMPTRLRRKRQSQRASTNERLQRKRGGVVRLPTGEFFVPAPKTTVTVLQIEIQSSVKTTRGVSAWPEEVDEVLAGWRALVEETGGLVQQPEVDTMRAIFGLFRPSRRAADLWQAVLHAVRLRELFDQNFTRPGIEFVLRGCVIRAETSDSHLIGVDYAAGVSPESLTAANALLKSAPDGTIVVDEQTRELLEDFAEFKRLSDLTLPGGDNAPVFAISAAK